MNQKLLEYKHRKITTNPILGKITNNTWMISDIVKKTTENGLSSTLMVLEKYVNDLENKTERSSFLSKMRLLPKNDQVHILKQWHLYPHLLDTPTDIESHQKFVAKKWFQTLQEILDVFSLEKRNIPIVNSIKKEQEALVA